jgi:hypothetical protein
LGLLVVVEVLVVEHETLQLALLLVNGVAELGLRLGGLIVVDVALVVAASGTVVGLPVIHAHPAELISAQITSHVVAALVLLYGLPTLWAELSMELDPVHSGSLHVILLLPLL